MNIQERQRYSSKPLDDSKHVSGAKYNSFGVSFEELDRRKNEEKRQINKMELTIQQTLQTAAEKNGQLLKNNIGPII